MKPVKGQIHLFKAFNRQKAAVWDVLCISGLIFRFYKHIKNSSVSAMKRLNPSVHHRNAKNITPVLSLNEMNVFLLRVFTDFHLQASEEIQTIH